jgi:transcription factor-like protein
LNIFGRERFITALDSSYADPLAIDTPWLCQLNLVFAIGLLLATPLPGTDESEIISRLRDQHKDLDEQFYLNAKSLNDPLTGFEDADFWSIQALLLMAVYMLTKSKRNTAFALLGMAVRSAYALGLHREDTLVVFSTDEQEARRNLWKSLFVMDRYLALSLGRPSSIFDDTLYTCSTKPSINGSRHNSYSDSPSFEQSSFYAIDAAVKSCSTIGKILKEVYQQRKISTRHAHEIAAQCKEWPTRIAPTLQWQWGPKIPIKNPAQGIALLHTNLFFFHSVILLTRPFFLFVLNFEVTHRVTPQAPPQVRRGFRRIAKFSEVCISSAVHTVSLVQHIYKAGYLPRRNPWVIYFLSSAALVLLANDIIPLHTHPLADECIINSLEIMNYCGVEDAQAERMGYILNMLREVVEVEKTKRPGNINQLPPVQSKHQAVDSILGPIPMANQELPGLQANPNFQQSFFSAPGGTTILPGSGPPGTASGAGPGSSPIAPPFMSAGGMSQPAPRKSSSSTPAPLEPLPPPSVPPNPLSPASAPRQMPTAGGPLDPTNPNMPFANLLDFGPAFPSDGSGLYGPSPRTDEYGPEENIDFESFWHWQNPASDPSNPGTGDVGGMLNVAQPMYGTTGIV